MAKKISINGGIGFDFTADTLREDLINELGDIEIDLSSVGGSVYDAFEIYNEIINYRRNTGSKVTIMLNGVVASAAAYLSMAATERIAYDNSVFMIHNAEVMAYGDHRTMEFWKTDLEKTDKVIASAYSKASGRSLYDINNYMSDNIDNNGTYFYGKEIVEAGFASQIIDTDISKDRQNSITESKMMILNFNKNIKPVVYDHEKMTAMLKTNTQQGKENIGEKRMDKKEILAALGTLKTNLEVTLPEIAKALNLESLLITDEQKETLAKHNSIVKLVGDTDPVEFIESLIKERKENAASVRSALIDKEFGPVEFPDTKKANSARIYAEKILGSDELTKEKLNEIKEDELYKKLSLERSDINDKSNIFGVVDGKEENKTTLKVVDY